MHGWRRFFTAHWPVLVLAFLELGLILTNIPFDGRWFLGWDSTSPEINLPLNLQRFFYGVWQEYRGLGTTDGMAHTANLVHWVYSALLSLVFPGWLIRPLINNLTHFFAGWGTYVLVRTVLQSRRKADETDAARATQDQVLGLVSAVFAMFNLLTIQMYNLPLELFSFHFAVLPWTLWAMTKFVIGGDRRYLLGLAGISLAGVSQAHVPTVFVSYGLFCGVWALGLLWHTQWRARLRRSVAAILVILLINSFWLLPYAYSVVTKSAEITNAKQNLVGTSSVFYRNSAWGTARALFTYGGFSLDYYDWNETTQTFTPIMQTWREWWRSPLYTLAAGVISLGVLLGLWANLAKRPRQWQSVEVSTTLAWLLCFVMLGTTIPGIGATTEFLREHIPLFGQIFRFTFTKFSLGYVIFSGILLSLGLAYILDNVRKLKPAGRLHPVWSVGALWLMLLAATSWPAWGKLYYEKLFVQVPDSYFAFAEYFTSNHVAGRYVTLPMHSLWGWTTNTTSWGYRGSGFLWQLAAPPMLDRAFDPWSKYNETAYFQLKTALYRQDGKQFLDTLKKFHLTHFLDDDSVFHPGGYATALFRQETSRFFSEIGGISQEQSFDNLRLYAIDQPDGRNTLPFAPASLRAISPDYESAYNTFDPAYHLFGDYVALPSGIHFPFSFLSLEDLARAQHTNIAEHLLITDETVALTTPLGTNLQVPDFATVEESLPVAITVQHNPATASATMVLSLNLPAVTVGEQRSFTPEPYVLAIPNAAAAYYAVVNDTVRLLSADNPTAAATLTTTGQNTVAFFGTQPTAAGTPIELGNALVDCSFMTEFVARVSGETISDPRCQVASLPTLDTPDSPTQLIAITFNHSQATAILPEVCVVLPSAPGVCSNDPLRASTSELTGTTALVIPVPTNQPVELYFLSSYAEVVAAPPATPPAMRYTNVVVETFPLVAQTTVTLEPQLAALTSALRIAAGGPNDVLRLEFAQQDALRVVPNFTAPTTKRDNCSRDGGGTVAVQEDAHGVYVRAVNRGILCGDAVLTDLLPHTEYLYQATGTHISGAGTKLFLTNPESKQMDIETITPMGNFSLLIPLVPSRNRYAVSNDASVLSFNVESYGVEENRTRFDQQQLLPLPLRWLSTIHAGAVETSGPILNPLQLANVSKHAPFWYSMRVTNTNSGGILVLPQGYDIGWIAFPAGQPWRGYDHFSYNGWANAWDVSSGTAANITVLYWPQLLAYVGFGVLLLTLVWLAIGARRYRQSTKTAPRLSRSNIVKMLQGKR